MRASSQFILRNIADEYLLIPVGEAAMRIQGLIAMSESGAMFFNKLKKGLFFDDLPKCTEISRRINFKTNHQNIA